MTRIFAMGGGGFTSEPNNPLLDRFVVSLARSPVPRICFLPTASGDPERQIAGFHAAFGSATSEPSHLSLFRLGRAGEVVSLREHLLGQDVIYVGGGSMANLLAIWRVHGLDRILAEAGRRGTVLCGLSAGSMCWFEGGVSSSHGGTSLVGGLGLLPGSNCVHYDGEPARRPAFRAAIAAGALPPGWAADDGVGLLFERGRLTRVVSSRRRGRAFHVAREGDDAVETPLAVEFLGDGDDPGLPDDIAEFRQVRRARGRG